MEHTAVCARLCPTCLSAPWRHTQVGLAAAWQWRLRRQLRAWQAGTCGSVPLLGIGLWVQTGPSVVPPFRDAQRSVHAAANIAGPKGSRPEVSLNCPARRARLFRLAPQADEPSDGMQPKCVPGAVRGWLRRNAMHACSGCTRCMMHGCVALRHPECGGGAPAVSALQRSPGSALQQGQHWSLNRHAPQKWTDCPHPQCSCCTASLLLNFQGCK